MLGKRSSLKYKIVNTKSDDVDADLEINTRRLLTPGCIWTTFSTTFLIALYFAPSIGLTFYQRWLLEDFKFPLLVVSLHLIIKYILSAICRCLFIHQQRFTLPWKEYLIALAPTGVFAGIDIAFSNWGLEFITISLYTMIKSTTIIFILAFAILFKLESKSWSLCTIVIMISTGLVLFTYKSTEFNLFGFTLLIIASMSSGLRWTCVQLLMHKSKCRCRNPIEMIYHMQPFMIISQLPFALLVEGPKFYTYSETVEIEALKETALKVLGGAILAFFMEITEVMVVTYTSSLTLSIAGIFKEILILSLAVIVNGDRMSGINFLGLVICLCGILSHIIHKIRSQQMVQNFSSQQRFFQYNEFNNDLNIGKSLLHEEKMERTTTALSESDDDEHDAQVLFNILNRHDR